MSKQQPISFFEFQELFSTEEACQKHLFEIRWPEGFVYPKCLNKQAYKIAYRNLFECSECGYQASVTAGTIFHKTRTPLRIWFWVIYLVTNDKRGVSAAQVAAQFSPCESTTVSKRKVVTVIAGRVSGIKEKILGAAFMGKRIFLCHSRKCNRRSKRIMILKLRNE